MNSGRTPLEQSWHRFRRNPLAMSGMVFIILLSLVSLSGHFLRPDKSVNANGQNLEISRQQPGFSTQIIQVPLSSEQVEISAMKAWLDGGYPPRYREIAFRDFELDGDLITFTTAISGQEEKINCNVLLNQEMCSKSQEKITEQLRNRAEKRTFLLGTDKYGRDVLSRLMAGASISLLVGAIAVLISLLIGISLGAFAGYYGGKVDKIIMWFINVIWSIPTLLLVIAITFAFGKGFWKVFLAVGLTMWVEVARVVRGQFLSLRKREFVEAGKVLGYSSSRIIFRHMLPNALGPIIVIAAANFAAAILIEAGLSFLGIGAQIPVPSWGNMIKENYNLITTDLAYLAFIPGICIMLLVLAFMLVGNGLRDALDVKG